jgi:putative hydrolase of the HAD superfamily
MTILFDLDNTLIDRNLAYFKWLSKLFESVSLELESCDWDMIKKKDNFGYTSRSFFYDWLIKEYKLKTTAENLAQKSFQEIHLFLPKIKKTERDLIEKLGRIHQLGIATNGGVLNQTNKLKSSGLGLLFEPNRIFISKSVGFQKPQNPYFEHIENSFQSTSEKMIMVGDDFEKDILGAKNAGWQTVWISKSENKPSEADYVIEHWMEIEEIIQF